MTLYQTQLTDRTLLSLKGEEAHPFLQSILSCDLNKWHKNKYLYGLLLTPQGRILFELFLWRDDEKDKRDKKDKEDKEDKGQDKHKSQNKKESAILIDVEKTQRDALLKKLEIYKLRRNIEITPDDRPIFALWGKNPPPPFDPRKKTLGTRLIGTHKHIHKYTHKYKPITKTLSAYHTHRIKQKIPHGVLEIPPEKSFPLEYGLDELHGIDFQKGCFIGQEVSSRMHRKKSTYKTLHLFQCATKPFPNHINTKTPLMQSGQTIGEVRAYAKPYLLGLLKKNTIKNIAKNAKDTAKDTTKDAPKDITEDTIRDDIRDNKKDKGKDGVKNNKGDNGKTPKHNIKQAITAHNTAFILLD